MKLAACFLMLSAGVYSAAQAEDPPPATQPPAAETANTQAPAPNAPAAAVATDAAAKPAAAATAGTPAKVDKSQVVNVADTDALIKQMRGRGYKPVNRNGMLVFCRSEGQLGSHFERTRCSTLDELKNAELTGKDYVNQIQQQASAVPFKP
jgi:hypothetical protein